MIEELKWQTTKDEAIQSSATAVSWDCPSSEGREGERSGGERNGIMKERRGGRRGRERLRDRKREEGWGGKVPEFSG